MNSEVYKVKMATEQIKWAPKFKTTTGRNDIDAEVIIIKNKKNVFKYM